MFKIVLIVTLLVNGFEHDSKSLYYSLQDCKRAGDVMALHFAPSEYRFTCESK